MNTFLTPQKGEATPGSVDLGEVLAGIMQRRSWIIFATLAAAAVAIVFVTLATPEYKATARIFVKNQENEFSRTNPGTPSSNAINRQELKSLVEVAQSRDLAKKVIKKLGLVGTPEFDPAARGNGTIGSLLITLGLKSNPAQQSPDQRALSTFYKKVVAYQIPESTVIVVQAKSVTPKTAADLANTLSEAFVEETQLVQLKSTDKSRALLEKQVAELTAAAKASGERAAEFRARKGFLKGRDQNSTLSKQELSELSSQIILAEAQRAEIIARAKAIKDQLAKTGSVSSSSEVLNSALIQRLQERKVALQATLTELSTTYLSNHPRIISTRKQIAALDRQIRREALKIVSGLNQQAKVATARVASLRASLNSLKGKASSRNLDEVRLGELESKAAADLALLRVFSSKLSDAKSRQAARHQPGLARVFSHADVPSEPYFPKKAPTVILATLGGMVVSLGLAFMASVMNAVSGANSSRATAGTATSRAPAADATSPMPSNQANNATTTPQSTPVPPQQPPYVPPQQPAQAQTQAPIHMSPATAPSATTAPEAPLPVAEPSLSLLPHSNTFDAASRHALSVIQNGQSEFAAGMAPVASWVNSVRQTLGIKRLAVTGLPGAELDTAAACLALARSLAAQNVRTIIVDAAMQGSQFAALTGTANLPGLADLLTGYASFIDVIIKDSHSDARIMRVGQPVVAAWPLLTGDRIETVLAALDSGDNHDLVIVHGGTVGGSFGTLENGAVAHCHSALLVVSADQANYTGNAMQQFSNAGMRASQYIRIANGGGARKMPENVTPITAAHIANAATQSPTAQAQQPAMTSYNTPLFPKVAI